MKPPSPLREGSTTNRCATIVPGENAYRKASEWVALSDAAVAINAKGTLKNAETNNRLMT